MLPREYRTLEHPSLYPDLNAGVPGGTLKFERGAKVLLEGIPKILQEIKPKEMRIRSINLIVIYIH
jgi:hypothetical protein